MKKLHKMMKAFAVCVALALVFCMIPVGSVYATEAGTEQRVTVTIENPEQQFDIFLFTDFQGEESYKNEVYKYVDESGNLVCQNIDISKARIGIKLINDNTYVWSKDQEIQGLTRTDDKDFNWFSAFYTINEDAVNKQDNTVSITIPKVDTTCS